MEHSKDDAAPTEIAAEKAGREQKPRNATLAILLAAVALLFLAGAFGVAYLVVYGPY